MKKVWKIAQIKPPVTIEWEDPDIIRTEQRRIVGKRGYNLFTDDDRILWWPQIRQCGVKIVEEEVNE